MRDLFWSRYPDLSVPAGEKPRSELRSDDGRFKIVGPVDEPGFRGYKLFHDGVHVGTKKRQKDAKAVAEMRRAAE